jgi:hypothetical protein
MKEADAANADLDDAIDRDSSYDAATQKRKPLRGQTKPQPVGQFTPQ